MPDETPKLVARNVSLTSELDQYVKSELAKGNYSNYSEVIRDAVKALRDSAILREARLEGIRTGIAQSRAEFQTGDSSPYDRKELFQGLN